MFSDLIRRLKLCHQIPERSFYFKTKQFPVCARCTGLAIGSLSAVFLLFHDIQYSFNLFCFSVLIMIPTLIDGYTQSIGLRKSNNFLRFFSSLIGGVGMVLFIIIIFKLFIGM